MTPQDRLGFGLLLEFTEGTAWESAEQARCRGTGARATRAIIEKVLNGM